MEFETRGMRSCMIVVVLQLDQRINYSLREMEIHWFDKKWRGLRLRNGLLFLEQLVMRRDSESKDVLCGPTRNHQRYFSCRLGDCVV